MGRMRDAWERKIGRSDLERLSIRLGEAFPGACLIEEMDAGGQWGIWNRLTRKAVMTPRPVNEDTISGIINRLARH